MMKRGIATIAVAAMLAGLPASAAEIRVVKADSGPFVLVEGDFDSGDGDRFVQLTASLPRTTTVVFDSPGGNLLAGLTIGQTIRARGYATLVADGALCASACAIAWLGGVKRFLASGGRLGFHAASGSSGVSAPGNAIVGAYMARLGLSQDAVYALTEASPNEIAWFDAGHVRMLGIAVENYTGAPFGGRTMLATRSVPTPPPSPVWTDRGASPGTPSTGGGTSTGSGGRGAPSCPAYVYGGHARC